MAILTVPAEAAQEVANTLVEGGVMGILNFSPIVLHVPEEVMVNNVNVAMELENLSYFIQDLAPTQDPDRRRGPAPARAPRTDFRRPCW